MVRSTPPLPALQKLLSNSKVYFVHMNLDTVYIEIFAVDLFSQVHAPTAKLKTANILFSNPHTSTSPIIGDHMSIHVYISLYNNAISSLRFRDDRACDSSQLRARQLGSEIRKIRSQPHETKYCPCENFNIYGIVQ